jgi:hypothetical protein
MSEGSLMSTPLERCRSESETSRLRALLVMFRSGCQSMAIRLAVALRSVIVSKNRSWASAER